jgi:hypothetical protein
MNKNDFYNGTLKARFIPKTNLSQIEILTLGKNIVEYTSFKTNQK